jgi:hypothetical protein
MDPKTKNLLKVGGGALLYYWAARKSHERLRGSDVVETPDGLVLRPFSKFNLGLNGVGKFLWGYMANEGLRGLGMHDDVALSWTVVGAATLEWYVLTNETRLMKLPARTPSLSPAVGWGHEWDWDWGARRHHHHPWEQFW